MTGYTARVTLEDGIRSTYDWYLERAFSVAA
jgi:nucleoside-diphosphate-sugar epimerase